jgi:small subunit ribosomal protein S17
METAERAKKNRHRTTSTGVVVSDKMDKTVTVAVERMAEHPRFRKRVRITKKFKAHDEKNEYQVGDFVQIIEARPLSKQKSWRVQKLIRKAADVS